MGTQTSLKAVGVPLDKIKEFENWLSDKGAAFLPLTNEWEELRFNLEGKIGIVYISSKNKSSFVGEAATQWELYKQSEDF